METSLIGCRSIFSISLGYSISLSTFRTYVLVFSACPARPRLHPVDFEIPKRARNVLFATRSARDIFAEAPSNPRRNAPTLRVPRNGAGIVARVFGARRETPSPNWGSRQKKKPSWTIRRGRRNPSRCFRWEASTSRRPRRERETARASARKRSFRDDATERFGRRFSFGRRRMLASPSIPSRRTGRSLRRRPCATHERKDPRDRHEMRDGTSEAIDLRTIRDVLSQAASLPTIDPSPGDIVHVSFPRKGRGAPVRDALAEAGPSTRLPSPRWLRSRSCGKKSILHSNVRMSTILGGPILHGSMRGYPVSSVARNARFATEGEPPCRSERSTYHTKRAGIDSRPCGSPLSRYKQLKANWKSRIVPVDVCSRQGCQG